MLHVLYTIMDILNYILLFYLVFNILPTRSMLKYSISSIFIIISVFVPVSKDHYTIIFFVLETCLTLFLLKGFNALYFVFFISIFAISDILKLFFLYTMAVFSNQTYDAIASNTMYSFIANTCLTLTIIIIIMRKHLSSFANETIIKLNSTPKYLLFTILLVITRGIVGLLQVLPLFHDMDYFIMNILSLFIIILMLSLFFLYFLLSLTYQRQLFYQHEDELIKQRITDQEKRFSMIRDKDTSMRQFRHDVRNHLSILNDLLIEKKYKEAHEYLSNIETTFEATSYRTFTGVVSVDAVISHYYQQMENNNIKFEWNNSEQVTSCLASSFELCTIFDNLLSNALHVCEDIADNAFNIPVIKVNITIINNHWHIHQTNPISHFVNIGDNGLPKTTKSDKSMHGLGSKNIQSIVNNYHGILKYSQTSDLFCVDIII